MNKMSLREIQSLAFDLKNTARELAEASRGLSSISVPFDHAADELNWAIEAIELTLDCKEDQ